MSLRVLVLHNSDFDVTQPDPGDPGIEARAEVAGVASAAADALVELGAAVQVRPIRTVAAVVQAVREFAADVVLNLCESLDGDARYESKVAGILERLGVAFTGSRSDCLRLCLDKQACGETLRRAGVPVPASAIAHDPPPALGWPLILKPNREDGSTGIWSSSVVDGPAQYARTLAHLRVSGLTPVIAQRYVEGRELNVALLGERPRRVLPLHEIDFAEMPPELPRIVSYESKWIDGSPQWQGTRVVPAVLDRSVSQAVAHVARAAAEAVGMGSYGRVDVRLDAGGRAWVVDVNPNCALAPDAGFARAAASAGLSHAQLLGAIVEAALDHRADRLPTIAARRFPPRAGSAPTRAQPRG